MTGCAVNFSASRNPLPSNRNPCSGVVLIAKNPVKKSHILLLAGLCAAGTLTGYGVRRIATGNPPAATAESAAATAAGATVSSQAAGDIGGPASLKKVTVADFPQRRSEDTLQSILALDPDTSYARIALWMTTADEAQLAEYWAGYKGGKRTVAVTDILFINWTRRNPQAAVAAVAGTGDERYAWWSWASNDPKAAIAAGQLAGKNQMTQVACGIGDFHPQWLREHLDEIPEEFRGEAFGRMRNWPAGLEPLATLDFMKKNGMPFDERVFANLAKEDPWSALDWMKENPSLNRDRYGRTDRTADLLISTLLRESPGDLEKLAAAIPAGATKRKMEQALFDHLLETDPDKAMEQAKATKVPLIAVQRLGQIGLGLVGSDSEKAFGIAKDILTVSPASLNADNMVHYPGGAMGYGDNSKASQLMSELFMKDRERTMNLIAAQAESSDKHSEPLFELSSKWLQEDSEGFSKWASGTTGKTLETASGQITFHLAQRGHFQEAAEWATAGGRDAGQAYYGLLHYWNQSDPEAAAEWLESSNLTDQQKASYRAVLNRTQP